MNGSSLVSKIALCFFRRTYKRMALSHLSPVAVSPLRTRARFTGSLLIGFYSLHAVICGVSVFILTHNHTPLGPTSTGTGTLNTSDISQQVNPYLNLQFRDTKSSWLEGQRQMWQNAFSSRPDNGQKASTRTSLLWGCFLHMPSKHPGSRNRASPLHKLGPQ